VRHNVPTLWNLLCAPAWGTRVWVSHQHAMPPARGANELAATAPNMMRCCNDRRHAGTSNSRRTCFDCHVLDFKFPARDAKTTHRASLRARSQRRWAGVYDNDSQMHIRIVLGLSDTARWRTAWSAIQSVPRGYCASDLETRGWYVASTG